MVEAQAPEGRGEVRGRRRRRRIAIAVGLLSVSGACASPEASRGRYRQTLGRLSEVADYSPYDPRKAVRQEFEAPDRQDELLEALRRGGLERSLEIAERYSAGDSPPSPAMQADLAVLLLEKALREESSLPALQAVEWASRAADREPDRPSHLFNLALARANAGLYLQAAEAWARYLALGEGGPWADEARTFSSELARPSRSVRWEGIVARLKLQADDADGYRRLAGEVAEYPFQARRFAERVLFEQWARARSSGDQGATLEARKRLEAIAGTLVENNQEHLIADALQSLGRAGPAEMPPEVIRAHGDLSRGLRDFHAGQEDRAAERLSEAAARLAAIGSPLADLARLFEILSLHERDHRRASERLAALDLEIDERRYPSLAGRVAWWRGILTARAGRHEEALAFYERGTVLMRRSSNLDGAQFGHVLMAEELAALGDLTAALHHHLAALVGVGALGEPRGRHSTLITLTETLLRYGLFDLARHSAVEAEGAARLWGEPIGLLEAALVQSRVRRGLGELASARRALAAAAAEVEALERNPIGSSRALEIRLERGLLAARDEPAVALPEIRQAAAALESLGKTRFAIPALVAEAEIHRRQGDAAAERAALEGVVERIELVRRQVQSPGLRSLAFHQAQPAIDRLARLAIDRGGGACGAESLLVSDRGRARFLLDLSRGPKVAPLGLRDLERVRSRLGSDTLLVEFAVFDDTVWVWKLSNAGLECRRLAESAAAIERSTDRLVEALRRRADRSMVLNLAGRLYDVLVRPLDLGDAERLIVVPDRFLRRLPLAALWNTEAGRFLADEVALSEVPSLALWLAGRSGQGRQPPPGGHRALVVANSLAPRSEPRLSPLRHARAEGLGVAAVYPGATVLLDEAATEERLFAALPEHDVLHIASHASANPGATHRSRLYLAPSGSDPGDMLVSELFERDLAPYVLVVLSACSTARGFDVDREGFSGLAGAFLARGAEAVVATRWAIADDLAARIMPEFHRRFSEHGSASLALRQAQSDLNSEPGFHPAEWSAFVVLGG